LKIKKLHKSKKPLQKASVATSSLVSKGGLFDFVAVNSLKSWAKTQSFCPLYGILSPICPTSVKKIHAQ